MFEDLDAGYSPPSQQPPPRPAYGQQEAPPVHHQNNQGGYGSQVPAQSGNTTTPYAPPSQPQPPSGYQQQNQGGYRKEYTPKPQGSFGGGGFTRKEDVLTDAYIPVAFYIEKDFPEEVKAKMFNLASKMIAKKMTVRINADDKVFIDNLRTLTDDKLEVYLPWRGFNELESKRTFNTLTAKHVASIHFGAWDKLTDPIKAILSSQVRLVFGDRNNSIALCVVTWSKDGASKLSEVSKDTGRSSFVIKMSSSYGFPVLNLQRPHVPSLIESTFSL